MSPFFRIEAINVQGNIARFDSNYHLQGKLV